MQGIISRLPASIKELVEDYFINVDPSDIWMNALFMVLLCRCCFGHHHICDVCTTSRTKDSNQYTKRVAGAPTSSYLPLKVNAAGVIPVIFASSFITTPNAIIQALGSSYKGETWYEVVQTIFSYNTVPGAIIYTVLIVAFTFFYAFVQVNPEKLAENLQNKEATFQVCALVKEQKNTSHVCLCD